MLNENRTKGENERENIYEQKRKGEEIIVLTASRRRAMKELGRERERDRERETERETERERLKM